MRLETRVREPLTLRSSKTERIMTVSIVSAGWFVLQLNFLFLLSGIALAIAMLVSIVGTAALIGRAMVVSLTVSAEGISVRNLVRRRTFAWSAIQQIAVGTPLASFKSPVVSTLIVREKGRRV